MTSILSILQNTPWWVYLIFAYLMLIGLKAARPRTINLKKLLIVPIFFLWMSIHSLITIFPLLIFTVGSWVLSLCMGIAVGTWSILRLPVRVDKKKFLIELPGSWLTLILILLIFVTKYYFNYQIAVAPQRIHHLGFELSMLMISGICTGLFVGRLLGYLYRFKKEPHEDLHLLQK